MSALDLFCAPEGAHTAPPHDVTAPDACASPEPRVSESSLWAFGAGVLVGIGASFVCVVLGIALGAA